MHLRSPRTLGLGALLCAALGCGSAGEPALYAAGPSGSGADPDAPAPGEAGQTGKPVERPKGLMTRGEAQRYMLALVNRDRAAHKLPPVVWDETAARAGHRHAEDMVRHGFTGHYGTDGSVPELRYTDAGGGGLVMENAGCFGDAAPRELDPSPRFSAESVERVQSAFYNEKPPADGHRRNILTAWHTSVGIGLAKAKGLDIACVAQEFVDDYGSFEAIPKRAKVGEKIKVAGEVKGKASIAGVGLSRVDLPHPRKPEELLKMGGYPIPSPYATYFPKGFKTPIPLEVNGNRFKIQVPLSDRGRPGLYGVSVWATYPGSKELRMISLRTVVVEK